MQYAEIPGNSRQEFYDGKFPGIPGGLVAHPAIRNGCPHCPPYRGGFKGKGLVGRGAPDLDPAGYPADLADPAGIRIRPDPMFLDPAGIRIRPDPR